MSIVLPKYTFSHVPLYWLPSYPVLIYTGILFKRGGLLPVSNWPSTVQTKPTTAVRTCRKLLSKWPRPVLVLDLDELWSYLENKSQFSLTVNLTFRGWRCWAPCCPGAPHCPSPSRVWWPRWEYSKWPIVPMLSWFSIGQNQFKGRAQKNGKFKDLVLKGSGSPKLLKMWFWP